MNFKLVMQKWLGIRKQAELIKEQQLLINTLQSSLDEVVHLVQQTKHTLDRHTLAGIDVNPCGGHQVVLVGRYKGNDYVEIFSLPEKDFTGVVDHMRYLKKQFGRFYRDVPVTMRAFLDQEL